jgi:hypothetical protein
VTTHFSHPKAFLWFHSPTFGIGARVHGSDHVGGGQFGEWVAIGADCHLWPGSSVVTYSYLDLSPCFWNLDGHLTISNSTDTCGGIFTGSCEDCTLSDMLNNQVNLTCTCNTGGAGSSTLVSKIDLSISIPISPPPVLGANIDQDQFIDAYDGHLSCSDGSWIGARGPNQAVCLDTSEHLIGMQYTNSTR